jgi:hypothetical protein
MARPLNFAVIADAHTQGGNLKYLPSIIDRINALKPAPDFVVSLGDCVYGLRENDVLADVQAYHREIGRLHAPHYYALGNHEIEPIEELACLEWEALLRAWKLPGRWYSFQQCGFHCCVLDSWLSLQLPQFAEALRAQLEWLARELEQTDQPVLVFTHEALGFQQSDCQHWVEEDNRNFWPPGNPLAGLLEAHSHKVVGVFEGHKHKSLHRRHSGIDWHLFGAGFQHEGQFAQVFIRESGEYYVRAHPDRGAQDAQETIQQTYGERSVVLG